MSLGCKDIGIRKSEFVAKTQFLSKNDLTTLQTFRLRLADFKHQKYRMK